MKRFSILLSVCFAMVGCGDDDDVVPPVDMGGMVDMNTSADMNGADAPMQDLGPTDMNVPDLGPPPTTYSGSITLLETKLLNPGTSGTFFGQGIQAGITFLASTDLPGPVLEASPGSPLGCKAWEYNAAQAVIASIGNDEGAVQITSGAGTSPPIFPACSFVAGAGYACPETTTAGAGGIIASGPMGTATLTDIATTFTAATTTNRYVRISGATNAANNGAFPIVALVGGNTIVYGNLVAVSETLPATATHINLAAVGPTPAAADPGFLSDDNTMAFALTPGGGSHFTAFTLTTGTGTVGDDFTLDLATRNLLNAIPLDGSEFTVGCEAGSCGTGSAVGAILNIVTTDAPLAGVTSPFAMPLPATRRVVVRCAGFGNTSMTIPAAYSALLMGSGATRIQATFIRPALMSGGGTVTGVSGHAIVGFTTPTAP